MGFFLLLGGSAHAVLGVQDLAGETLCHGSLGAGPGIADQPTQSKRLLTVGAHVHRDLIGRTADAARLDLQLRLDIVKRGLENFQGVLARLIRDDAERIIHDSLRDALLAVIHHVVHQLGHQLGVVQRIRQHISFRD